MKRSAKRRDAKAKRRSLLRSGMLAAGEAIARNPGLAGGVTAFAVTFLFVSANAIWYQPHAHKSAFFETRDRSAYRAPDAAESETLIRIQRQPADPAVQKAQEALGRLQLYTGAVDGIPGPRTKKAVEDYQRIAGIAVSGEIDAALLTRLAEGADTRPAVALPDRTPLPGAFQTAENIAPTTAMPQPQPAEAAPFTPPADADPQVVRIQAGLKAFGNDGIEIDGVAGSRTKAAIREFQTLFGLPVTGEPDDVLYAKMQEIGLTN